MALVDVARWIVGLIISLGIINALARFYYEYEEQEKRNLVISSAYWVAFTILVVFSPVLHLLSPFLSKGLFHTDQYAGVFSVALLALLFGLITDIGMDYLRIQAESVKYVKISLIRMVFLISCNVFFVVYLKKGVIGVYYATLLSSIIFSLLLAFLSLRRTGIGFSISITRDMVFFAFPLIFSSIFRGIINESDKLFINYFFSPFETGLYAIAQKVGTAIHSLITSPFLQTFLPRRFQIMKRKDARQSYSDILTYYLVAICAIGMLIALFSHQIIHLMTTEQYYGAAKFIPAIVLSMIIFGLKYHFETGIAIAKKTRYIAYVNGIAMGVNVLLNWLLISHYGILGAVISMNCSYLVTTILTLFFAQKTYPIPFDYKKIILIFTSSIVIFIVSIFVPVDNLIVNTILKLLLYFIFVSLFFICKILPQEIVAKIRNLLPAY